MADETYVIRITIQGKDDTSKAADTSKNSLQALATVAKGIAASAMVKYAKEAVRATVETVKLGASSLAARDRLVAFAGGAAEADEMLEALVRGSDRTIDRMTAMSRASLLIEQGLVSNARQMELAGAAVSKLGNQTWSMERRMSSLASLLANQSTRRLDDFGVSVDGLRKKQKLLEAQGMSTEAAFSAAFFELVADKVDVLGDTSDSAATQVAQLEAAWTDMTLAFSESVATMAASTGAISATSQAMRDATEAAVLLEEAVQRGGKRVPLGRGVHAEVAAAIASARTWRKDEDALRVALEEEAQASREAATAAREKSNADREAADSAQKRRDAMEATRWMANWRAQQEVEAVAAMQDNQGEVEEATRAHQERLRDIYESGQKSRTQIAQDAHQERLEALNKAMQAEMDALAKSISARKFQENLEALERRHQDRIASIRNQARESDKEREDRHFRDVMERLDQEQQARLRALRIRFGKDTTAADQRETLEDEHKRRMMGLYTDSARAKEVERHQEAMAELEFQEAESALLEQFETEKEAAEREHANNLAAIDAQRIQEALAAEDERYRVEVQRAQEARNQQQADQAARQAIEQSFAAQQADLERTLAFEIAAIEQQALNQRIAQEQAAHRQRLADLDVFKSEMNRKAAESPISIPVKLQPPAIEAGQHWEEYLRGMGVPGFATGGVSPGGLAVVGERGPELLNLPGGTRVTPMSRATGGGGVTIVNNFGPGSIRSERDVRRIAEDQQKMLRLRGLGGLN